MVFYIYSVLLGFATNTTDRHDITEILFKVEMIIIIQHRYFDKMLKMYIHYWCKLVHVFIVCLYMYCRWRSRYQDWMVGIPLTGLNMFVTVPSNDIYCGKFVLSELRWEVIVPLVDIGGIVNYLYLNVLFIITRDLVVLSFWSASVGLETHLRLFESLPQTRHRSSRYLIL